MFTLHGCVCTCNYVFAVSLNRPMDLCVSLSLAHRYAKYYKQENGTEFRTLMKAFGIRFDVLVYGNVSGTGQLR